MTENRINKDLESQLKQEVQNYQNHMGQIYKRFSQRLEIQGKQKDALLQRQRQKFRLEKQQQKSNYEQQLRFEIMRYQNIQQIERQNFDKMVEQQRKKNQQQKQILRKLIDRQREQLKQYLNRQAKNIREQCIRYVMDNWKIQIKYQIQSFCFNVLGYSEGQKILTNVIECIERGLNSMKNQLQNKINSSLFVSTSASEQKQKTENLIVIKRPQQIKQVQGLKNNNYKIEIEYLEEKIQDKNIIKNNLLTRVLDSQQRINKPLEQESSQSLQFQYQKYHQQSIVQKLNKIEIKQEQKSDSSSYLMKINTQNKRGTKRKRKGVKCQ